MNKQAAKECIDKELVVLQELTYTQLKTMVGKPFTKSVTGSDGIDYQLEIEAFWDTGKVNGDLRVRVAADDGKGLSTLWPLIGDIIMAPDGSHL